MNASGAPARSYLVFREGEARFGLSLDAVREIVWLPELSPIEELPDYIVGVFNLRGRVVAVMDLSLRFGHARTAGAPSDQIVVIDRGGKRIGLIASETCDVATIDPGDIDTVDRYQVAGGHAHFVWGEARRPDGLVMLLDLDALLEAAPSNLAPELGETTLATPLDPSGVAGGPPGERELFRDRARRLAPPLIDDERAAEEGFMVVRLEDEWVGLRVSEVREVAHLKGLTPLPCSPPWVLGSMNLRGDILTLIDIRPALGLVTAGALREVVVVQAFGLSVGVAAAEIIDILHLGKSDIVPRPAASRGEDREYCEGVATVAGRAITLVDVAHIVSPTAASSSPEL